MDIVRTLVNTPYALPAGIVTLVLGLVAVVFLFCRGSSKRPGKGSKGDKTAGKKGKSKDAVSVFRNFQFNLVPL